MDKELLIKFRLVSVFASLFLLISFSFFAGKISADETQPIPGLNMPCDKTGNPEFNSLRPYQAAPCVDPDWALYCGNKIGIVEEKTGTHPGCVTDMAVNWDVNKDYYIDLSGTSFPILGNTELVQNSQNPSDQIDDATKMNEYVSWYLNGVDNRAEYGVDKNTGNESVNFSGPIQKLLPGAILDAQRVATIASASATGTSTPDEDTGNTTPTTEFASHNQIVVCGESSLGIIGDWLHIGTLKPIDCYKGNGSGAQGDYLRLKDWNGDLSFWNAAVNFLVGIFTKILPGVPADVIKTSVGNHWNSRMPPLPWGNDPYAKPARRMTAIEYQKYYSEWRGQSCVIVPLINQLICINNWFVPNRYADLFEYVPLASTPDKRGKMPIFTVTIQPGSGTVLDSSDWTKLAAPTLYYAHTQEVMDLSNNLNQSYIPKGLDTSTIPSDSTENNYNCKIVNVRSNPGDNLFTIKKPGDVGVHVNFHVSSIDNCECIPPDPNGKRGWHSICHGAVYIGIHTDPNKVPNANEIWTSTVAGNASTFRRIYPKVENGAPVSCIADIPSVTNAAYTPVQGTNKITVEGPLGSPDQAQMDPQNAKIYFPHFGSVYDYFLKGIQTALRPKGFGDPTPISGQDCKNVQCGQLPTLPKASGSCNLGGTSSRVGNIPSTLKQIISAAAQTYKVPPNLILGIMYGEGLFNPGRLSWTDENAKNWATCQKVPGCNESGDDNFLGFNGSDWTNIVPHIKSDLLKLDPTRTSPSQCNLLDAIYGLAWNLHDSADGGGGLPPSCFGIALNASVPGSCSWNNNQYEDAIKVHESGYTNACLTREGSCATGGGLDAACPSGGDTCETINNRYPDPSHNACVWDVAHGN